MGPGQTLVGRIGPVRVGQAAGRLEQADRVLGQPPLGPAADRLGGVENLERDALSGQAGGVVGHRDPRAGRPQVEAARRRHDLDAGLGLEQGPRLVGSFREADVIRPVI